jgi:hypothetical protein
MDQSDYDTLARLQVRLEAECAVIFGIPRREGRAISSKEYHRAFELIDASDLIANILARHAKRQRRIAGSPPPPQPPVIAARPRPVKRALLPGESASGGHRRRSPPALSAALGLRQERPPPTPNPRTLRFRWGQKVPPKAFSPITIPCGPRQPPATAIARLARCDLWAWLPPHHRREIIARAAAGLSRADCDRIAELLQRASHAAGWHWPIMPLWLSDDVPPLGCVVRYRDPRTGHNRGPWCVLHVTASFAARLLPSEGSA